MNIHQYLINLKEDSKTGKKEQSNRIENKTQDTDLNSAMWIVTLNVDSPFKRQRL